MPSTSILQMAADFSLMWARAGVSDKPEAPPRLELSRPAAAGQGEPRGPKPVDKQSRGRYQ